MFCEAATSFKPVTFCTCTATHRVLRDAPFVIGGTDDIGAYCETHAESVRRANSQYALKAYIAAIA